MKILVIDDHPLFLDGLLQVLLQLDPDVAAVQVTNAEAALERLTTDQDFQLILVDIGMPGMDGLDLLKTLAERELWIPAVVISAHDNPRSITRALDAGALGFIPKSFGAEELLGALQKVLKGEIFLPESVKRHIRQLRPAEGNVQAGAGHQHGVTPRQIRVLELLAKGFSNRKIALAMNLSEHTVKSHLKTLFAALNADNRTACVHKAEQLGLILKAAVDSASTDD
jgi:DNA-binding NarL/FixJ family response regulator